MAPSLQLGVSKKNDGVMGSLVIGSCCLKLPYRIYGALLRFLEGEGVTVNVLA